MITSRKVGSLELADWCRTEARRLRALEAERGEYERVPWAARLLEEAADRLLERGGLVVSCKLCATRICAAADAPPTVECPRCGGRQVEVAL